MSDRAGAGRDGAPRPEPLRAPHALTPSLCSRSARLWCDSESSYEPVHGSVCMACVPRWAAVVLAGIAGVLLPACGDLPVKPGDKGVVSNPMTPAPSYEVIARTQSLRIADLDRLWARATLRMYTIDKNGDTNEEEADGHVQYIRDRRLFLAVKKLGETYFQLGSNDTLFWWIDLSDSDHKVALVGEHAKATPKTAARFGLPVHPLDLIDVLCLLPFPDKPVAPPNWTPDGRYVGVTLQGRWGHRRVFLDPKTLVPRKVEAFDGRGALVLSATMSEDEPVKVKGLEKSSATIATEIEIDVPASKTRAKMSLHDPENRRDGISASAFDLKALLERYGVKDARLMEGDVEPKPTPFAGVKIR